MLYDLFVEKVVTIRFIKRKRKILKVVKWKSQKACWFIY